MMRLRAHPDFAEAEEWPAAKDVFKRFSSATCNKLIGPYGFTFTMFLAFYIASFFGDYDLSRYLWERSGRWIHCRNRIESDIRTRKRSSECECFKHRRVQRSQPRSRGEANDGVTRPRWHSTAGGPPDGIRVLPILHSGRRSGSAEASRDSRRSGRRDHACRHLQCAGRVRAIQNEMPGRRRHRAYVAASCLRLVDRERSESNCSRYPRGSSSFWPARASHRKNNTTITAGIAGAHQALIPNADSDVSPSERMTNIIPAAQTSALMKLNPEN